MSCNLNIVKNFRLSRTLFIKEDGSPTLFYTASPSDALKEIIEGGGGILVTESELEQNADQCIKLCDSRNDPKIKQGYLPLSYIKHCVMRNKLINEQFYRDTQLGQGQVSPPPADKESNNDGSGVGSKLMLCPQIMGRKKYTLTEDLNIIKYLIHHKAFQHVGGNIVWKRMEALKVTDHSFQSMKYRYLKSILPGIDQYDIPATWISKLTKTSMKWTKEKEEEEEEEEDNDENDDFQELQREEEETLDPEAANDTCDESIFEGANEKSNASTLYLGSKLSEKNRKTTHPVNSTSQKHEINVTTNFMTNTMCEEGFSSETDSAIELFSVGNRKDNLSVTCKAKDPKFANSSSLADNDDVDKWIVKEIAGGKEGQSHLNSYDDEVSANQRLQATDVHIVGRMKFQQPCLEGEHFHPGDLATRELTRHRLEAIMRHYKVTQSEAAYLWLQHPDKFWKLH